MLTVSPVMTTRPDAPVHMLGVCTPARGVRGRGGRRRGAAHTTPPGGAGDATAVATTATPTATG